MAPACKGGFGGVARGIGLTVLLVLGRAAGAQVTFTDVGPQRGILPYVMPVGPVGGIAAADYDADGFVDMFVPNAEGAPDQLYHNLGNGSFEEIAASVGLASLENNRVALWFDYNGDHRLDLVVGADCRSDPLSSDPCANPVNLRLYRQNLTGMFEDVTIQAGLDLSWGTGFADSHRSGLAAGDINNDGFLDLYVCALGSRAYLYLNNADGTFTDVTIASGMSDVILNYHQPVFFDFNRDGWIDMYVAVDSQVGNLFWINQGDGMFLDMAANAGVDHAAFDMGITLGDYDNDGDIDIYVTEIGFNVLYRNDSIGPNLSFVNVAVPIGVSIGYWGWGTTFLDANNDTLLDLAATNGKVGTSWDTDPSRFWLNQGGDPITYLDVSDQVQFNDTYIASSLIAFDYDRDGDLDMMQSTSEGGPLRLLDNAPGAAAQANHYLVVRPRMGGPNHYAIGAVVRITAGSTNMMRPIHAGISTVGQEPAEAFFGLGGAAVVDQITIEWPDSSWQQHLVVAADQVVTYLRVQGDFDWDGAVSLGTDLAVFVSVLIGETASSNELIRADMNLDAKVDGLDIDPFVAALITP